MARNGRGGVRYGLVFVLLFALIAFAIGVKTQDSVAAVLSAEAAAELSAELAAGVEQELETERRDPYDADVYEPLDPRDPLWCGYDMTNSENFKNVGAFLSKKVGEEDSYLESTKFVTYCLTLDDKKCENPVGKRFHYKGQTNNRKPLCPIEATTGQDWVLDGSWGKEKGKLVVIKGGNSIAIQKNSRKIVKGTKWDPSNYTGLGFPPFDKLIIDNYGVWRCKHIANFCYCRDELRDHQNATGENIYERTCMALMTKPFCKVAKLTEAKSLVKSLCDPHTHILDDNNSDECGVCE
jgi:hypothetical protein